MKFIVFDLDETLGYFKQMFYIFSVIGKIQGNQTPIFTQSVFNRVLDLYPEYMRPNIMDILLYLRDRKQSNHNTYIIIYTNNEHQNWTKCVISYIENKLGQSNFFDKTINSLKLEPCRQYQKKHLADLFRCIDYSTGSTICYIDNEYHPGMRSRQTNYNKLDSYVNNITMDEVINRLYSSDILNEIIPNVPREIFSNIYQYYCKSLYDRCLTPAEYLHEVRNTQELFIRIRIFFMNCTTQKRRHTYSNNQLETGTISSSMEITTRNSLPLVSYKKNLSDKTKKNRRNL